MVSIFAVVKCRREKIDCAKCVYEIRDKKIHNITFISTYKLNNIMIIILSINIDTRALFVRIINI